MARSSRTLILGAVALLAIALVIALTSREPTPTDDASDTPTTEAPSATTTSTTASTTTTTTTVSPRVAALIADTEALIERSTPEELAYRLVVTGLTGRELSTRLTETVGSLCVGGVFLTESNNNWAPIDDRDAFASALFDLTAVRYDAAVGAGCEYGPLITTDAELGSVVRVPVESPPAAPDWTSRYIDGAPYDVLVDLQERAHAYGTDLLHLGVDVNFGTVADVDTAPDNFMARQGRTFGDDAGIVAALANAVVRGQCEAGIAPTLKHFPNQGATPEDPHRSRSFAGGGLDLWETTGRLPYVDTEAPLVMTGHIFMDIDAELPASMSSAITTGLLRDDLGYEGVVITDDLSTMQGAIDVIADPGDRAVAAIRAGADLVLFVDDRDVARVVEALTAEMDADPEFLESAQGAFRRTLRLHLGLKASAFFPLCGSQS